jgi:simple sugar transport system ATP-binding protein
MSFIEFKDISKAFQNFFACEDISLNIEEASIHSIVGENGAGKSTLMKILGGLVIPTKGNMRLKGAAYTPKSALDAYKNKIAFIHQHFVLGRQMTAFENILLSRTSQSGVLKGIPKQQIRTQVESLLKKFNWSIQLDEKVENISVGEQQRLEILKALLLEPDILIFDEPTAVLTPQESDDLLDFILQLKAEKKTVILISHKLNEIKKVSDTISIMRAGRMIQTTKASLMSLDQIAETMIGRKSQKSLNTHSNSVVKDRLFEVSNIQVLKSEIFGIAGIEGNGQTDFIQKVIQLCKKNKLSYGDITEDRIPLSVFQNTSLTDHVILKHYLHLTKNGLIQKEKAVQMTQEIIKSYDVRPGRPEQSLHELSGGNQQKFIVGRELFHEPEVLMAAHPTRGVDLGAQEMIHQALIQFSQKNKTVFLVSSDLDEILNLSNRFIILYRQKIFGPFAQNSLNELQIGQYMTGQNL